MQIDDDPNAFGCSDAMPAVDLPRKNMARTSTAHRGLLKMDCLRAMRFRGSDAVTVRS
jgi:hypothetical protein